MQIVTPPLFSLYLKKSRKFLGLYSIIILLCSAKYYKIQ
jgi:hypothetical protein